MDRRASNKFIKKISWYLILAVFLAPTVCSADWSQEDTVRELFFIQTMVVDWKQTRDISKSPWRREANPVLGRKPSLEKVNWYFSLCSIGHFAVSYFLPEGYRDTWQLVWIGIQSNQIDENNLSGLTQKNIGFSYNFKYAIEF